MYVGLYTLYIHKLKRIHFLLKKIKKKKKHF